MQSMDNDLRMLKMFLSFLMTYFLCWVDLSFFSYYVKTKWNPTLYTGLTVPFYPCILCSPVCVCVFTLPINLRQTVFRICTFVLLYFQIDIEQEASTNCNSETATTAHVFLLVRWWCKVKTKIMSTCIHDHRGSWFMIDFIWFSLPVYFTCCSVFCFCFYFFLCSSVSSFLGTFFLFRFCFTISDIIWIDSNSHTRARTHAHFQSKLTI